MQVEQRPLSEITPYEQNPRRNDGAVKAVADSIREFGFRQPIVVDPQGVIVVGHTRWKAARELKLETVPVHVAHDLTPEQARAYRLADNKTNELAEWDDDLLAEEIKSLLDDDYEVDALGFGEDEISSLLDDSPTVKPLDTQAPPKMTWVLIGIPTVQFGDISEAIEQIAGHEDAIIEQTVTSE